MVKAIVNIRSANDGSTAKIFFRLRTDESGFTGKIEIKVGPQSLPDLEAAIAGEDSLPFSAIHRQQGRQVVKISAGDVSRSALLDLDQASDP